MASADLGRATIALLSDPGGTQVLIPQLVAMPRTWSEDTAFVRFVGDTSPTPFHGEGEEYAFALTCRYFEDQHVEMLDLLTLLKVTRRERPDRRLLLRTNIGLAPGLDTSLAVDLDGPVTDVPGPVWSVDISFTVRVVQHSFYANG